MTTYDPKGMPQFATSDKIAASGDGLREDLNLISASASAAITAEGARIEGKRNRGWLPDGANLNNYNTVEQAGQYNASSTGNYSNTPAMNASGVFELATGGGSNAAMVQRLTFGNVGLWREAVNADAGTWSEWFQVETTAGSDAKDAARLVSAKAYTDTQVAADRTRLTSNESTLTNHAGRIGNLETIGGLAPGDVSDATIANIVANAASNTNAALAVKYANLTDVNTPTVRFDQFPVPLTDATTINSAVTNQSIATAGGWVFSVFYGSDMNPYAARVRDGQSSWQVVNLGTLAGNPLVAPAPKDEHNQLAIVVDGDGFIHVFGNHHRVPLNYIRSKEAYEITGWDTPGMVGTDETEVTYPDPKLLPSGDLLFFYRSGTSADGDMVLNKYTRATKTWSRVATVLKGHAWGTPTAEYAAGSYSAYPSRVVVDQATGKVHFWWLWRSTTTPDSNQDLHYTYSTDSGATWRGLDDAPVTLPILPTTTATRVFAGKQLHTTSAACVDSAGNPHAIVRFSAPVDEMRHYKRVGGVISYEVIGTSAMGDMTIFGTTDGKVYSVYTSAQVWIKQLSPTQGTAVRIFPWTVYNYRPSFDPGAMVTDTLRLMLTPSRAKAGGNYGGVLTMQITPAAIDAVAAGKTIKPRPLAQSPLSDPTRLIPGTYPMVPGMYYGPTSGARTNSPSNLANGTFRGQFITAARAGKIVECSASVITAGAAGAKIRFVIYRTDGKVVAQSADVDVTTTGIKTAAIYAVIGKNETFVIGTLHHSSTGASAVLAANGGSHDSRLALGNVSSYFASVRGGFSLTGLAVPAVDQAVNFETPAAGASVATADNNPIVVIKAGDMPTDWSTGSE